MTGQLARLAVALQRARELEPAHVGEHPIDEDQVGALVGKSCPRRAAILGLADLKSGALQTERDHLAYRPLVLNDQNLFGGHGVTRCMARVLQGDRVADS